MWSKISIAEQLKGQVLSRLDVVDLQVKRIKKKFNKLSAKYLLKELDENPHLLKALD